MENKQKRILDINEQIMSVVSERNDRHLSVDRTVTKMTPIIAERAHQMFFIKKTSSYMKLNV